MTQTTYQHTVQTMVSGFDFLKKWYTLADIGNVLDPTPVSRRLVVVAVLGVVVTAIAANGMLPTPVHAGFGAVCRAGIVWAAGRAWLWAASATALSSLLPSLTMLMSRYLSSEPLAVSWYHAGAQQFWLALVVAEAGGTGWDRLLKGAGETAMGTAAQWWPQWAPPVPISRLILEFERSVFQSFLYDTCRTYLSFWHQLAGPAIPGQLIATSVCNATVWNSKQSTSQVM